jgi:predicted Fe-Mo cluster-binding NifX family protein
MKICITAKGPEPASSAEERFGRAPYFMVFDQETGTWKNIKNPHADAAGGVGPRAAQILVEEGASALITGNVGGNALNALKAAKIAIYLFKGQMTVQEAYGAFQDGSLIQLA